MKISIIGAGAVGAALTRQLCEDPDIDAVNLVDQNGNALIDATEHLSCSKLRSHKVNIDSQHGLAAVLNGSDCVISALPYMQNKKLSQFAIEEKFNFTDLGGDNDMLAAQLKLDKEARKAGRWIIPNTGIAPGLINILAMDAVNDFEEVDSIHITGGGLPLNPVPPFNYQVIFSPAGLVKEYADPSTIIRDGKIREVESLTGKEDIELKILGQKTRLERFFIAGRITSLVHLLKGKVKDLDFKTIRYPGHLNVIRSFKELGFLEDGIVDIRSNLRYKDLFIRQLTKHLPRGAADFVYMQVEVKGKLKNKAVKRTYIVEHGYEDEDTHSALVHVTALSALITAKFVASGSLKGKGGVSAPEGVVDTKAFIKALKEKGQGVIVRENELKEGEV